MKNEIILKARGLQKEFPGVKAVRGVDLDIREGVCFGLLGPNGAGKTTTIEMMEGITEPSSGEVHFRDEMIGRQYREKIGIQFQSTALQDFVTVHETLEMFSQLYRHSASIDELIEYCSLGSYLDQDPRNLSGGQRQRLLLALALINNPDLIFLDEPTTGLDPQARRNFWDLIQRLKQQNKTVILTTHYMEEAYLLCDEIAIMDQGKIIAQGRPDELLEKTFGERKIQLPAVQLTNEHAEQMKLSICYVDDKVEIVTEDVNKTIAQLLQENVNLDGLQMRKWTLEDLFLELTGKDLRI